MCDNSILLQNNTVRTLSNPHPNWLLVSSCSVTPLSESNDVLVLSRSNTLDEMPDGVEDAFKEAAVNFGIEYDKLCSLKYPHCKRHPDDKSGLSTGFVMKPSVALIVTVLLSSYLIRIK